MKVTVYDSEGNAIGIAWHEDDHGYVELPPATRECVATHFTINDGTMQPLTQQVRVPVDSELRLRLRDRASVRRETEDYFERLLREAFRQPEKEVDNTATDVTWWQKLKSWF